MKELVLEDYGALCRAAVEALADGAETVRIPDPDARWHPGGAHGACGAVIALAMAVFDPSSPRRGDEQLHQRLVAAADALKRLQHDDGLIDLGESNFHSPPDAAFIVEDLAALYQVLRGGCEASARRDWLLSRLEEVIVRACGAMAGGGVHTPNHRWKMASALTLAERLWPHSAWRQEARAYLGEGIDIDQDGEFTERSTGVYNYVCDRALILLGRALGRQDLAELADRNLRHMLYLLHADGTLVTNYSRRQDRDRSVGLERYLLLYWYRALMGGEGLFWSAAELGLRRLAKFTPGSLGGLAMWLRLFGEAADKTPPQAEPLPAEYEKRFTGIGVLRRRSGAQSLTVMAGSSDLLSVRFGAGPEIGLRVAAAFAPRGQFLSDGIEGSRGRYRLRSRHACEYYGPGPDPLPATDWRSRPNFSRRVFVGAELTMTIEIEALDDGLRLHLASEGCSRVPVEVALHLREFDEIESSGRLVPDPETGRHFLDDGDLIVHGPTHVVRIGPGAAEHDLRESRTAEAHPPRNACCVRLVTPVNTLLTIRAETK